MSNLKIRKAMQIYLRTMPGVLPLAQTVFEATDPDAKFDVSKAHQKLFLLPAANKVVGLKGTTSIFRGIFQVNLCYPSGNGSGDAEAMADKIAAWFAANTIIASDGLKVRIKGKPSIGAALSVTPYVIPVSITYESTQ